MTFKEAWNSNEAQAGSLFGSYAAAWNTRERWIHYARLEPERFIHLSMRDDWKVEYSRMDFATAMKHVQNGKKVRRRGWRESLFLSTGDEGKANRVDAVLIQISNVFATDWEVVE